MKEVLQINDKYLPIQKSGDLKFLKRVLWKNSNSKSLKLF